MASLAAILLVVAAGILAQAGPAPDSSRQPADSLAAAQPTGALTGRLTDLHSAPLAAVTVILQNQATGARLQTVTGKNGIYRFAGLAPGLYSLRAESAQLGSGELDDIEIAAGHEARVQAAVDLAPASPVAASNPRLSAAADRIPEGIGQSVTLIARLRATPRSAIQPLALATQTALPLEPLGTQALAAWPSPVRVQAPVEPPVQTAAAQPGLAAPAVTTTLSGDQVQSLPVSGRRWQQLFLDTPAATSGSGNALLALRGAGQDPADATVDGASTRLAFGSAAESSAALAAEDPSAQTPDAIRAGGGSFGGRGFAVSSAAIREVRIEAGNVEAEGAHAAGGRAGVETQSGGNQFHGQAFFSDRQNDWGARNPFTQLVQNTGTAAAQENTSNAPASAWRRRTIPTRPTTRIFRMRCCAWATACTTAAPKMRRWRRRSPRPARPKAICISSSVPPTATPRRPTPATRPSFPACFLACLPA